MHPAEDQALFSCPVVVKGVVAIGSGVSLGDGPGEGGTEMSTTRPNTETPCPWCRDGQIVLHDPKEEWWVTEEGSAASDSYSGKFPAGIRRKRFRTPPVEWFSCTNCAMTGTVGYLTTVMAQAIRQRSSDTSRGSCSAVKRGSLASAFS